jgi:hypothetical protein
MSTYAVYGEIVFPANNGRQGFKIRRFSEVKTESSWQSLTDTADIVIPRKARDFDSLNITEWFREGDPVEIWFGYDGNVELEFEGYISSVPIGIPLVIKCEDEMYKLKRTNVSVSMANCNLKELLQAIAPGYNIVCDETHLLGSVRFSNMSASQILEELDKSGIKSWFEGKTLHAFGASKSDKPPVKVLLEKTAGESLKQKAIEDTLVTISLLRKIGKKLVVKYGEEGAGRRINRQLSGITMSENEMLNEAKKIYNAVKVPGLDGDVTLFGVPRVQHGMRIDLSSVLYPEKTGVYYIDAVTKTLSENGIRQTCKLGDKSA